MAWVRARLCKLQKTVHSTRLAAASDKVYQLLAIGRWFSPDTPASSTTKTGRHDIAEILLKVALKHQKSNQIIISCLSNTCLCQKTGRTFIITFFFQIVFRLVIGGPTIKGKKILSMFTLY